jgi:hypothetical protein
VRLNPILRASSFSLRVWILTVRVLLYMRDVKIMIFMREIINVQSERHKVFQADLHKSFQFAHRPFFSSVRISALADLDHCVGRKTILSVLPNAKRIEQIRGKLCELCIGEELNGRNL